MPRLDVKSQRKQRQGPWPKQDGEGRVEVNVTFSASVICNNMAKLQLVVTSSRFSLGKVETWIWLATQEFYLWHTARRLTINQYNSHQNDVTYNSTSNKGRHYGSLWFRATKCRDVSNRVHVYLFMFLVAPHAHLLLPHCMLPYSLSPEFVRKWVMRCPSIRLFWTVGIARLC